MQRGLGAEHLLGLLLEAAQHLRQLGGEFGATTGRPRRPGWFDGAVVRPFEEPASVYGAGHRGADLAAAPGTPVRAANDGVVSFADILAIVGAWGPCTGPCPADLDGDGLVGFSDILEVIANWT